MALTNRHSLNIIWVDMWIILQILFLLLVVPFTEAATPCHICGDRGNDAMKFPNVILDGIGKTCTEISLDVALKVPINSGQCQQEQNKWGVTCCSGQRPNGSDPPQGLPPQRIPDVRYVGPHPVCNVCRDGDYPSDPSMVLNFLYIGVASCAQYYKYGREGRIAPYMCQPVQFFSYEPCGCGEFSPYFNNTHGQATPQLAPETNTDTGGGLISSQQMTPQSGTPSPTVAPTTGSPSANPSSVPSRSPIAKPSANPSSFPSHSPNATPSASPSSVPTTPSASPSDVYIPQSLLQQLTEQDLAAMKKRYTPNNNGKDHVNGANGRGGYGGKNQGGRMIRRRVRGFDKQTSTMVHHLQ